MNELRRVTDAVKFTSSVLLDFSNAFNTIESDKLVFKVQNKFNLHVL